MTLTYRYEPCGTRGDAITTRSFCHPRIRRGDMCCKLLPSTQKASSHTDHRKGFSHFTCDNKQKLTIWPSIWDSHLDLSVHRCPWFQCDARHEVMNDYVSCIRVTGYLGIWVRLVNRTSRSMSLATMTETWVTLPLMTRGKAGQTSSMSSILNVSDLKKGRRFMGRGDPR